MNQGISPNQTVNHTEHAPLHIISSLEIPECVTLAKVVIECGGNPNVLDLN